jgi:hypothetical protein
MTELRRYNPVPKIIGQDMNFEYEAADDGQIVFADNAITALRTSEARVSELEKALNEKRENCAVLAQEVDQRDARIAVLEADLATARQTIERLSAPVSDEELRAHFYEADSGGFFLCNLEAVDKLIAARVKP